MDMVESLLVVIKKKQDGFLEMCLKPKTASILLLGQILGSSEGNIVTSIAKTVVSAKAIKSIVESLEAEWAEERIAAVGILLRCMQEDGKCRHTIADKAELAPVLESFMGASDGERRTFNEQVLHIIKDEGAFSTMHTLLIYLQTALQDQCPVVAGGAKKDEYIREEAMDTLISCLRNSDFPAAQIAAAETIVSLQGRFSSSGKSLTRASLLKRAGLDKSYRTLMQVDQLSNSSGESEENWLEEEQAADEWERKMAFVLVSHEFGLLFEALAEGLRSRNQELFSSCFLSATWLIHMLTVLPDTGIRGAARVCLLKHFISMFKSAKGTEEKALSMLALSSFIHDPEGLNDLTSHMKDILKGLRQLKKSCILAVDMLKVFSEGNNSSIDLWNHKELVQVDCQCKWRSAINNKVPSVLDGARETHLICSYHVCLLEGRCEWVILCLAFQMKFLFMGYGLAGGSILHLIHETREHTKAVTSLAILESGERLYSGSLDRTARIWSIGSEAIYCVQIHDMKDQVNNLVVANSIACFIPQGAGVKEIDLATGTLSSIQSGTRKLLGKSNPVHALQIWSATNYSMVGSLASTMEVRTLAVSSELIYLGSKSGTVEIWCRKKLIRVETLQTGTNGKVQCMAVDGDEEVLVVGTSDGRIQHGN
ncbi:putative E3 ubiquitin-protein ligase LIN-1 [Vitis vinifera]|uniref:Putative E3 ubiquitin-protein ligase LIN-1 n=1 Tax=Vitis vinifera TaxID=29760 RepID=A0A438IHU0_VITVI|nr:putative E3 ubiquitin-protein ligase LIN-1 [Vitis vinifera]